MLFPLVTSRVLYSLLLRRLWSYPSVKQLRERREEAARAEELGESINTRLGKSSDMNFVEVWRIVQVFGFGKSKSKPPSNGEAKEAKAASKSKKKTKTTEESLPVPKEDGVEETGLKVEVGKQAEDDVMLSVMSVISDLVDFHERVKK